MRGFLLYSYTMTDDHVSHTIAVYDSIAAQYAVQAETRAPEVERERFCDLLPPGGHILDVGCGSGRDAAFFEHHGFQVAGIDLSQSLLTLARKIAFNADFYAMDMRHLTFPDASYDGIWCCAALLHLKRFEIPPVMQSFYRILKPGGTLFILVKQGTEDAFSVEPSVPGKSRYFSYFSDSEMKEYIADAGFSLLDMYNYNEARRFSDGYPTDWIVAFAKKP